MEVQSNFVITAPSTVQSQVGDGWGYCRNEEGFLFFGYLFLPDDVIQCVALTESGEFWESRICVRQRLEERLREEVFWGAALGETAANQDPYAALLELVSTSPFFWSLPVAVVNPDYCLSGGNANSFLGRFQAEGADPRAIEQLSEAWNASLDPEIMAFLEALETLEEMPPTVGLYGFLRGVTGEERARRVELVRRTPAHFLPGFFQSEPATCHRNPWGNPLHLGLLMALALRHGATVEQALATALGVPVWALSPD